MKLKDLISICNKTWVNGFLLSLEKSGVTKKSRVASLVANDYSEDQILQDVYNSESDKTRKTFNQTTSTLYKDLLFFLLIQFREFPDELMKGLRQLLASGQESEFLRKAEIAERTFTDCEAFDHQINLFHLLQDHHFQNKYSAGIYGDYTSKLRTALTNASNFASIEEFYLKNDLGRRNKKDNSSQQELAKIKDYYSGFFSKKHPDKTRIRARVFWLKTLKLNDYFNLTNEDSKLLAKEVFQLMRKRPFLYFNLPEIAEFTNLSYQLYTSPDVLAPKDVNELFSDYFEQFDDERLIRLYPRIVQAMITAQARYYGEKAGFRFIDDPDPMDPEIERGLFGLLPMVKKVRNQPNLTNQGERLFGLETEAMVRQHLPGAHRKKAIDLFRQIQVQEQQFQNVMGTHMVYANLVRDLFWAKRWDELLEEIEKYERFIKAKGELNPLMTHILVFSEMVGKIMLNEIEMPGSEVEKRSQKIFEEFPGWYDKMAAYTIRNLKL